MAAIVHRAILDAQSIIESRYARRSSMFGYQTERASQRVDHAQRELMSHIRHEWFGQICQWAGIHQDWVLKEIETLEERAKEKYVRH